MPTLTIKNVEYSYEEGDVIAFPEGLVGLPQIRRAVVVPINDLEPFCWLAPVDHDELRFVVVDPSSLFDGYESPVNDPASTFTGVLAIVTLSSDWTKTTFNLKAPILVDREHRTARQRIINDSPYHFDEQLPLN
jgi:flagellar assembly factor FliW